MTTSTTLHYFLVPTLLNFVEIPVILKKTGQQHFYPNIIYFIETFFVHVRIILQWLDSLLISDFIIVVIYCWELKQDQQQQGWAFTPRIHEQQQGWAFTPRIHEHNQLKY